MLKTLSFNTEKNEKSKYLFGLIVIIAASLGLALNFIHLGEIKTDGSIFSSVALKDLYSGGLYQNAWENKPPAIFFTIEFFYLIVPSKVYALFILAIFTLVTISVCQYFLIIQRVKSFTFGLLLSLISIYFTIFQNNIGEGLCTEIYGTLCILLSISFFELYYIKNKNIYFLISALSLGTSFWFKEPFIILYLSVLTLFFQKLKNKREVSKLILLSLIPSAFIIGILFFKGSLFAYIDCVKYNFHYLNVDEPISLKTKFNDLYLNLIHPIASLSLIFIYFLYKNLSQKKVRSNSLFQILFIFSACAIFAISPHNFGHYYFPTFALIFIFFAQVYETYKETYQINLNFLMILICLFTFYQIDQIHKPNWTYQIKPYQEDKFVKFLKTQKGKTLFVDYVEKGDYYVKTGLLYPTFLPIALPIHFGENQTGITNRNRIWKELNFNPPDYLITTYTNSYFTWFFPESDFYTKHYNKIDSIFPNNDNVLYLWKIRNNINSHESMK